MTWTVESRNGSASDQLTAMLDAIVGGSGSVEFDDLHEAAHRTRVPYQIGQRRERSILVLVQDWASWILEPSAAYCVNCFLLWRLHDWSALLENPAAKPVAPLIDGFVQAQIVAFARMSDSEQKTASVVRCVATSDGLASDHAIIRHPNCSCNPLECALPIDIAERIPNGDLRGTTLSQIAARILPLVRDTRVGPIRAITRNRGLAFASTASATLYPFRHPLAVEKGFGRSGSYRDDPVIAAVETLERFAGMQPRGCAGSVRGSFSDLHDRAIDPERFILHSKGQQDEPGYALSLYDPDRPYQWVPAYSFRRDAQVLVPQQLAYYDRVASTDAFVFEVSNGCAAGSSLAEAALHGLFETIERDAFLGTWHTEKAVRRIDVATSPSAYLHAMTSRLAAEGLEVDAYDLSTGETAVRSMAVRVRDPDHRFGPAALYGSGGHIHGVRALEAAMAEAVTNIREHSAETRRKATDMGLHLLANPSEVRTMDDHQLQCWPRAALTARSFVEDARPPVAWGEIVQSSPRVDPMDAEALLALLASSLMDRCTDVLIVDQSFHPVAALGLWFAKVLVPGLLPMTFGQQYRRLSGERLHTFLSVPEQRTNWRNAPHVFP